MDDKFDGIVLTLFGYNIEFQQSIINWLILCVLFSIFSLSGLAKSLKRPMFERRRREYF